MQERTCVMWLWQVITWLVFSHNLFEIGLWKHFATTFVLYKGCKAAMEENWWLCILPTVELRVKGEAARELRGWGFWCCVISLISWGCFSSNVRLAVNTLLTQTWNQRAQSLTVHNAQQSCGHHVLHVTLILLESQQLSKENCWATFLCWNDCK